MKFEGLHFTFLVDPAWLRAVAVSIESFSRGNSAAKGRSTEKGGLFAFHRKSVLLRGWSQLRAVAPHFLLRPEKICKSLDIHLQHAQQGASGHRVHLEKGTSGFPFATFDPLGGKPNCGLWERGENYYGVKRKPDDFFIDI